ncbi:MAG: adenylyltransferase/cytidyltransferase family protein [Flavobacteriales bacterium]|nr:adenylyltransferase/cytidyltransferase family protein [Flavobacteriales bacterium]
MNQLEIIHRKIFSEEGLIRQLCRWRLTDNKIVFTNGCFDLMHAGHIDYLSKARDLGDVLIVAVNSDNSVKSLNKGIARPIQSFESRSLIMASLHFVDAIVEFDDETPLRLIELIKPDVLVKGGDYDVGELNSSKKSYIVGSNEVRGYQGKVLTIPFVEGYSTSAIEMKILNSLKGG